jgi:hypothetical protein
MRSFLGSKAIMTATWPLVMAAALAATMTSCGGPGDFHHGKSSKLAADGVSFDPVPTDVTIDCNYHILQGTQRFRGTYFVIPKVNIARDVENKAAIKLMPLTNGNIAFDFAMNLQRGTESRNIVSGPTESERFAHTCNFEKLREQINKHYEDLKQPENKVWSLSPLPITNIEVRIDGIGQPVLLSPQDTDLTTWLGETLSATIELDKDQTERLMAKVSRGLGIQLITSFKFEARQTREFGTMTFNGSAVANALESQIGYEGPVYAGIMLESELKTKLATAIRMSSAEAVIESDSDQLSEAANSLIKMMMEKVSPEKLIAKQDESSSRRRSDTRDDWDDVDDRDERSSSKSRTGSRQPTNESSRGETERRRTSEEDPWDVDRPSSSIRDRIIRKANLSASEEPATQVSDSSGAATETTAQKEEPETRETDKPADNEAPANRPATDSQANKPKLAPMAFKVSAVLDFLRSQTDTKIQYRILGKLVSETATTRSRMISAKVGASDERSIEVSSGAPAQTLGIELDKDQKLTLMIAERKLFRPTTRKMDPVYFSKAALLEVQQRDGINLDFPQLVEWGRAIKEYAPNEMTGPRAYVYDSWWNPFNWSYYVWGKVEHSVTESLHSTEIATEGEKASLKLQFSRTAQAWTLGDLVKLANSEQQLDAMKIESGNDGSITITAKQRLGAATLQNTEKFPTESIAVTSYFQEHWSALKNQRITSSVTWSPKKKMKDVPSGRSAFTVRLLQSQVIPDVTFFEN